MAKAKEKDESTANESMESILGKIKSIVSGDDKVSLDEPDLDDEEPMELTEIVDAQEEAQPEPIVEVKVTEQIVEQPAPSVAPPPEPLAASGDHEEMVDILQEIDQALEKQYHENATAPAAIAAPVPPPVVATPPQNANVAQAPVQNVPIEAAEPKKEFSEIVSQNIITPQVPMAEEKKENILSQEIAQKSSKAIQSLINNIPRPDVASPAFRSATTVEDVVVEMIRPMLKEWLDKNLEVIVREIVEKEIKKIIPRE